MGRIYSKYIIIQVLSYASDRDQVVRYIPKVSRRYRLLCIENYSVLNEIVLEWKSQILKQSDLIQSEELIDLIMQGLPDSSSFELELLFRGSRDGFKAVAFHERCDNQGATLSVIQSAHGHIFGGYTQLPWKHSP